MINTPFGRGPRTDGYHIRTAAAAAGVPCLTTMQGVFAAVRGIEALREGADRARVDPGAPRGRAGAAGPGTARLRAGPRPRARRGGRVKRVRAEVLSTRKLGAYHPLTVVAPEIAEKARPGQFVAVRMPEGREFLLRRHLAIHQASRRGGWAGTLEFVDRSRRARAPSWLASARAHSFLDVIGPLGQGLLPPKAPDELPARGRAPRRGDAVLPRAGAAWPPASASTW